MLIPDHPTGRAKKQQSLPLTASAKDILVDQDQAELSLPLLLQQIKGLATSILEEELKLFFESLDCDLMIAADNLYRQTERDAYYFAMRTLHDHQIDIINSNDQSITQRFSIFDQGNKKQTQLSFQDLTVLKNEDTDELLALQSIAKKHDYQQKQLLAKLCSRLNVFSYDEINIETLPFSPRAIATSLSQALAPLYIDIKVRLFILNQFDNALQKILPKLYSALDQQLIDNGIINDSLSRTNSDQKSQADKEDTSGYLLGGDHLIREFGNIPSVTYSTPKTTDTIPMVSAEYALPAIYPEESPHSGNQNSQPIAKQNSNQNALAKPENKNTLDQLLEPVLEQLKSLILENGNSSTQSATESFFKNNLDDVEVAQLIQKLSHRLNHSKTPNKQPKSQTILNELMAVSLGEESLAVPVKALLGRLHILLADVIEKNPDVILNEKNSARQLLNALVRSGSSWHKNEVLEIPLDPLYQKMTAIVDRAVDEAPFNDGIFSDLLSDFEDYNTRERNRMELIEKRLLSIEEGRIKADAARAKVSHAIKGIFRGKQCCDEINELINLAWHQILFVKYLKHGEDSLEYISALHILRDTHIATLTRPSDILTRHLLAEVKNELNQMGMDSFDTDRLLKNISLAIKASKEKPSFQPNENIDINENTQSEKSTAKPTSKPILHSVKQEKNKNAPNTLDTIKFNGPKTIITPQVKKANLANDSKKGFTAGVTPYIEMAKGIKRGALFDYTNEQQITTRCRLVALIEGADIYIFGNRLGQKIIEKNLEEVADLLKTGKLQVIDNSHLFDNALEKVIEGLRKDKN